MLWPAGTSSPVKLKRRASALQSSTSSEGSYERVDELFLCPLAS